jgi:alkylation response protein AidB-like acyl-CoA dehydrogenase
MNFAFTDEQQMLRDAVRGALERAMPPATARVHLESGDARAAHELAIAQGWTGIGVPEEAGGQGGGLVELAILAEEQGYAAGPDVLLAGLGLADPVLAVAGTDGSDDDPAAELRADVAAGGSTLALVVPSVGRPATLASALETEADGTGRRLTGAVELVLGAAGADVLLVVGAGPGGPEVLAVAAQDAHVASVAVADLARPVADVRFDGAPARVLGRYDHAADGAILDRLAVLVAADALGASRRMLDLTVEYVLQREQFGQVIGGFQAVKHAAADMLVDVETSFSAVYHAAATVDAAHPEAAKHAAIAHWIATTAGHRVGDRALAMHGAVGFTWEHDLHFPLKRARRDGSLFADQERQLGRIADELGLSRAEVPLTAA